MTRKVIQISDGIFLCNDGTMWSSVDASTESESSVIWTQLPNVPQPKTVDVQNSNIPKPVPPKIRTWENGK